MAGYPESVLQAMLQQQLELGQGRQPRYTLTAAVANTDVAAAAAVGSTCQAIVVLASAAAVIAFGEATTATVGVNVPANQPVTYHIAPAGTTPYGDGKVHAQSASAGATIQVTELAGAG